MRSESVEWWTNVSDSIVVAKIATTTPIDPLNQYWKSQEVICIPAETLRGERLESITFRQNYREGSDSTGDDLRFRPGNKVLLFCSTEAIHKTTTVAFWINLTKPDPKFSDHAPYDNDCNWIAGGDEVVKLVKARITTMIAGESVKKRGLIVPFVASDQLDLHWDFVRTADPDYKPILIKQLRDGDRISAIYNLISYPGKDTQDLIRPFLKDSDSSDLQVSDGKDASGNTRYKTIKIFPVKQAAYTALTLMGESPQKPEGYDSEQLFSFIFSVGFEHRSYFPYGDWKRIEDRR